MKQNLVDDYASITGLVNDVDVWIFFNKDSFNKNTLGLKVEYGFCTNDGVSIVLGKCLESKVLALYLNADSFNNNLQILKDAFKKYQSPSFVKDDEVIEKILTEIKLLRK